MRRLGQAPTTGRQWSRIPCPRLTHSAFRISEAGTEAAGWDKNTWPELENLAKNHPEAGVHFQGCFACVRPPESY